MGIASIDAHRRVVNAAKDSVLNRINSAASATEVSVELTQGMQAGLTQTLKLSGIMVGARSGSDIMLLDEDVLDDHAQVTFHRSAFGVLAHVRAMDGDVLVNGTTVDAGEELTEVTLPFELAAGSAQIRFRKPGLDVAALPGAQLMQHSRAKLNVDPVMALGALCLAMLLAGGLMWHLLTGGRDYVIDMNAPDIPARTAKVSANDWQTTVNDKISEQGLDQILAVSLVSDNILQMRGQVPEPKLAAYRDLQTWYDAQHNPPSMVWQVEQRAALARMPNIGMVRFSDPAAVILTSGTVVTMGEELVDGWVLSEISDKTLSLKRGLETQMVDFRAANE